MSPALAGGLLSTAPPGKSSALNSFLPHFSCPDSIAYIVPLYGVHSSHWLSIFLSFSFCFFMWILSTDLSSNSLILFSFSFLWSSVVKSLYWTFQITHYVWMLSRLSHVWLFVTLWTVDSSVHGILQARTLEWVAMPSSRGSSGPRIEPESLTSLAFSGGFFTTSANWDAHSFIIQFQNIWLVLLKNTGAYYTEWSKPERKTPIQYTNTYIWNLERW